MNEEVEYILENISRLVILLLGTDGDKESHLDEIERNVQELRRLQKEKEGVNEV